MKWNKLGRIYEFQTISTILNSHASNPLAVPLEGDTFRIFYSCRDVKNRSSVTYIDYDLKKQKLLYVHKDPSFSFGSSASFYSDGVSIGNLYSVNETEYILFMGWQNSNGDHWRGDIGRLRLDDTALLELDPKNVFIGSDEEDKVSLSYPWVIFHKGIYKMWYGSTVNWEAGNGEMLHIIKYAISENGHTWVKHGLAIPYILGKAQAFSRPTLWIDDNEVYHMYFSYRGTPPMKYRIGYAISSDGINWFLKNEEAGIDVSDSGWDSEMICYPFIFDHKGERYMLYNGNGYGQTGFGLAVLENDGG